MKNEFEYDDEAYAQGTLELQNAISRMWGAGASIQNLEDEIANALENETGQAILVDLDSDGRFAAA